MNPLDYGLSISSIHCPYTNLAIENYLIEGHFPEENHLFLYRNDPSIVMGRFQVPWREINFSQLPKNISLVRRRSGGGTVYHDLGNWNYCFIHKQRDLPRKKNLELIIAALDHLGFQVEANDRYDLVYRERKEEGGESIFKVSGSAFKQKKETSLHHGTLLMDAKLQDLRGSLGHPKNWKIEGKGVRSVSSPVINLSDIFGNLSFEEWYKAFENLFNTDAFIWREEGLNAAINDERKLLSEWSWLWGETPRFELEVELSQSVSIHFSLYKGKCEKAYLKREESISELLFFVDKSVRRALKAWPSFEILLHHPYFQDCEEAERVKIAGQLRQISESLQLG